jgi:hypothetical protein
MKLGEALLIPRLSISTMVDAQNAWKQICSKKVTAELENSPFPKRSSVLRLKD